MEPYFISKIGGTLWLKFPQEERERGRAPKMYPGLKIVFDDMKRYFPKSESGYSKEEVIDYIKKNPAFVDDAGERKTVFYVDPAAILKEKVAVDKASTKQNFVCPGCGAEFETKAEALEHMKSCILGAQKPGKPGRKKKETKPDGNDPVAG